MKKVYDGLAYMRIPIGSSDIFTGSLDNCIMNVQNIMSNNVCISQTMGESYCSEYSYTREDEWLLPRDPNPGTDIWC